MATSEVDFVEGDTNSQLQMQPKNRSDNSAIPIDASGYQVRVYIANEDPKGVISARRANAMTTSLVGGVPTATFTLAGSDLKAGWIRYEYEITYPVSGNVITSQEVYRRRVRARLSA